MGVFALGLVVDPKPLEACPAPGCVTLIYATGAIANALKKIHEMIHLLPCSSELLERFACERF
jgi:hypothetical protein